MIAQGGHVTPSIESNPLTACTRIGILRILVSCRRELNKNYSRSRLIKQPGYKVEMHNCGTGREFVHRAARPAPGCAAKDVGNRRDSNWACTRSLRDCPRRGAEKPGTTLPTAPGEARAHQSWNRKVGVNRRLFRRRIIIPHRKTLLPSALKWKLWISNQITCIFFRYWDPRWLRLAVTVPPSRDDPDGRRL